MQKINSLRPIESEHTLSAAFKNHKGKKYVCTTVSGCPAILNIYNLDDGVVKASFELEGSLNSWNHIIGPDGRLYVMTYAKLYRYDFDTEEFKAYGCVCDGETECFAVDSDKKENLYFGSCLGGKIIKFNVFDETFEDYGQVAPGVSYVRSLSVLNGNIYCGVKGDSVLAFYRINAENPQDKEEIPVPEDIEYYPSGLRWIYTSTAAGNKIIIHCKADKINPLLIYDTEKKEFSDTGYKGNFPGLFSSPERNGKSYFAVDGKLMEISLESGKVSEADFPPIECNATPSVDFISDGENAEQMIILDNLAAAVLLIDLENKKSQKLKLNPHKGRYYIQAVEAGDFEKGDNGIYISAYCGDRAVRYDTVTGEIKPLILGQAEGMTNYNGIQYMGIYPGNILYSYDFRKDEDKPVLLGKKSEKQDRPFAMCSGDGKIFMGTIPDYGYRGGDIIIYDIASGTEKIIKEPVKNQSVIGLSYHNGIIYGSTSVWGGLSAAPDESSAKIFAYDLENEKLIKIIEPVIQGVENPTWIGQVSVKEDNLIWGITGNTLFKMDFEKEEVIECISFGEFSYSRVKHRWRPTYIRYDKKGTMYVNIMGIHKVNPGTLEFEKITEEDEVLLFTLDDKGRVYYVVDEKLFIMEDNEEEEK